jgi:hypothetical protein
MECPDASSDETNGEDPRTTSPEPRLKVTSPLGFVAKLEVPMVATRLKLWLAVT